MTPFATSREGLPLWGMFPDGCARIADNLLLFRGNTAADYEIKF
jgi:hypothetical protein